jgi:hypothetical protein
MSKKKFTYPQLALCEWLFEENPPGARFLTLWHGSMNMGRQDFRFHEVFSNPAEDELLKDRIIYTHPDRSSSDQEVKEYIEFKRRMGGSLAIDTQNLLNAKIISTISMFTGGSALEDFCKKFEKFDLGHNHSLIRRTASGKQWWLEEGKALYEAEHRKRLAKRKDTERTIVIGAWMTITAQLPASLTKNLPDGMKLPTPKRRVFRPFGTATVTSQTEKRIGITELEMFRDWEKMRYSSHEGYSINWPIQGREPNLFITNENLMVDHADTFIGSKLHNLHTEEEQDFSARATDHMSRIVPMMLSMHQAMDQQQAGLEDMTREMIANFTGSNSNVPKI